ncbi:MAG: hypothetical protein ACI3XD_04715 [Oscillospiraceae bacterium]
MSSGKIAGIIMAIIGAIGDIYAAITIANDTSGWFGYTYTAPFSQHETTMITIAVVSGILLIAGIFILFSNNRKDA